MQGDIGHPLHLTIDADLQFLVQEAVQQTVDKFNAKEAAVIIMDPKTGEIIAMLSYPYFDPNNPHTTTMKTLKTESSPMRMNLVQ